MIKTILSGNMTADPILNTRNIGGVETKVVNFTVAVNEGSGEQRKTTYVRVHAWRGLAETIAKYTAKGSKVLVTGPVRINSYVDKNGSFQCNLELRADEIEFLSAHKAQ